MNKAVVVLALTTLTFGSASAYLMRELRNEREQTQALQSRVERMAQAQLKENPFAVTAPVPPITPPAAHVAEPPRPATAPAMIRESDAGIGAETPAFRGGRQAMIERTQQLLQEPEYRKAMLAQQTFSLSRMHPDLQSALRLQPEEADRLLELLAEQQLNQMAIRPPFGRPGAPPDQYEMQKYQEQAQQLQREREAQIASLLGDSKLQEWQNYQKTLGARMQIRELRTTLAESGIPLREGQVEPLVAAIASEQERRSQDAMKDRATLTASGGAMTRAARVDFVEQDLDRAADYNQRLHDAAAPYLSIDQLRQFDRHLERQLEMQRVNLQLMRAQQDAAARGDLLTPYGEVAVQSAPGLVAVESVVVPR